jgi:hypothetical protein
MEAQKYLRYLVDEIHTVIVATVDDAETAAALLNGFVVRASR